jgi:hypothetical protein
VPQAIVRSSLDEFNLSYLIFREFKT